MEIEITNHAKERMRTYDITENLVKDTVKNPDNITEGYGGRNIYQKKLNGYVLRVIVEENREMKRVITVYKARGERYGV